MAGWPPCSGCRSVRGPALECAHEDRGTPPADHVAKEQADVLLIDLDARHFDAIEAVRAVKAARPAIVVIGYVGHEKTDIIEAARAAGADQVMAKGEFARRLPELLSGP
jgi:DNA-binding NarL/FixJ family response regulator